MISASHSQSAPTHRIPASPDPAELEPLLSKHSALAVHSAGGDGIARGSPEALRATRRFVLADELFTVQVSRRVTSARKRSSSIVARWAELLSHLQHRTGWELSPAYDVNPISMFEKAARLSTAIVPDEFEASTEFAIENAGLFNLDKPSAKAICKEVEAAVGTWRSVAQQVGAPRSEIDAIESAFGG